LSQFFHIDPDDPQGPRMLNEYKGIRPGDEVVYRARPALKSLRTDDRLVVTELVEFGENKAQGQWAWVLAVLNDGEFEVDADNLRKKGRR